jgi:hypothetical protein
VTENLSREGDAHQRGQLVSAPKPVVPVCLRQPAVGKRRWGEEGLVVGRMGEKQAKVGGGQKSAWWWSVLFKGVVAVWSSEGGGWSEAAPCDEVGGEGPGLTGRRRACGRRAVGDEARVRDADAWARGHCNGW